MGTADEGSFLELLIANERIQKWLDELAKLEGGSKRHVQMISRIKITYESCISNGALYCLSYVDCVHC